jgi:hypothetical protein
LGSKTFRCRSREICYVYGNYRRKDSMKTLLVSASLLAMAVFTPAQAASTLAVAGGASFGHVVTGAAAATTGPAIAGSIQSGASSNVGAGFAVATPAGGLSTGIGASIGNTTGTSGVIAGPGGAGVAAGSITNTGVGVGGGFTNVLP